MNIISRKKYALNISLAFVLFVVLVSPFFAQAESRGITYVCPPKANPAGSVDKNGNVIMISGECTFDDLIKAVKALADWGTLFALSFSVIVLAYAGFLYMTSGGSPGQITKATDMLTKVVIGIVLILAAWLIVTLIIKALGVDQQGINTFLG